jgi:hypothetical protein
MGSIQKVTSAALATVIVAVTFSISSVMADTITSPNYTINGNLGGSFGGQVSSTNYTMSTIGGEAVVGGGQSGSYIIDQQLVNASTAPTMQLAVQPGGMVAYYPFNENAGATSDDASANTNNGTLVGSPTWATGKLGSALSFNGSNGQSFSVSDNTAITMGSKMTVSLWANQSSAVVNKALASHWDYTSGSVSGGWALQVAGDSASRLQFFVAGSATDPASNYVETAANTWATGGWHHIVAVYDGTQSAANRVNIYIDGVAVATTVTGTIPPTGLNAASPLKIGDFNGLNRTWNGGIDHFKLFNRALSAVEVSAEYTAQNSGTPTGLTLGALTGPSATSTADAIVRTNSAAYGLSVQQDHDLQSGANTIPAVGGSIAAPMTWAEGVTEGFGFTVTGAPTLDAKWGTGSKYAAFPSSVTSFYNTASHNSAQVDVVNLQMRLDVSNAQTSGAYANTIVYTGTTLP